MPSEMINQMTMPPQSAKAAKRKIRPKPVCPSSMGEVKGKEGRLSSLELRDDGPEVALGKSAGFFHGDPAFGKLGSP